MIPSKAPVSFSKRELKNSNKKMTLSKKEKGLMDMDNSVVIARGSGLLELNGNVENTIMIKLKENNV